MEIVKTENLKHVVIKTNRLTLLVIESAFGRIEYLTAKNLESIMFHTGQLDTLDLNDFTDVDLISFTQ